MDLERVLSQFVYRLAKKLEYKGDISLEEAFQLTAVLKICEGALDFDPTFYKTFKDSVKYWFDIVERKLPARGNYIHSIPVSNLRKIGLNIKNKDINDQIDRCRAKLSFIDGIKDYIEWFIPTAEVYDENLERNLPIDYERIKQRYVGFAGEIELLPEVRKIILKTKDVFGKKPCVMLGDGAFPEMMELFDKEMMFQASVLRVAMYLKSKVIYLQHCSTHDMILMHPSDIDKISPMLKYTPDDMAYWMLQRGYINKEIAQKLLSGKKIYRSDINGGFLERKICYEFAEYCRERCMSKERKKQLKKTTLG